MESYDGPAWRLISTLCGTMQAGQDSGGGVGGTEKMCTLHAGGMLWFLHQL